VPVLSIDQLQAHNCGMLSSREYQDYLLHQAVSHPDLLHVDDNRVFAMSPIEEAIGDIRDARFSRSGFMMRGFEGSDQFESTGMWRQTFSGGYMVCKSFSLREEGSVGYYLALAEAQRVAVDIMEKMVADSHNGHPVFDYAADESLAFTSRSRPVAGDGSFIGWIVLFTYELAAEFCSPAQRVVWTDGGLSPIPINPVTL
jgi:hypothetical protein